MDAIYGTERFLNEIAWERTWSNVAKRYGPVHDVILFYASSKNYQWNGASVEQDPVYIEKFFTSVEQGTGRRYRTITLNGPGTTNGDSGKPWRGINPTSVGRHWSINRKVLKTCGIRGGTIQERLDALDAAGRIEWPKKKGGIPQLKWYLDELEGKPATDMWDDIGHLSSKDSETLGYPTQKPIALLERIIKASSNPGDIVLDPFCGCGTAIAAAQKLNRRWVGIDLTHVAVSVIRSRLAADGVDPATYEVVGIPKDEAGAEELFNQDPYQFQAWACGLAGIHPNMKDGQPQKGADQGIDGRLRYQEVDGTERLILAQVKGGKTSSRDIRDLSGTMRRQNATFGFFITLNDATKEMTKEAATVGTYRPAQASLTRSEPYMRLQIRTVKQLLDGEKFDYPAPH